MVRVYHPGPRARGLRICGKLRFLADDGISLYAVVLWGRANGCFACALALGRIILARDVAALSRPNGSSRLVANSPCGSKADGGEGAWLLARVLRSLSAAGWCLLLQLVGPTTIPERRLDKPPTWGLWWTAWGRDHAVVVGWRCWR